MADLISQGIDPNAPRKAINATTMGLDGRPVAGYAAGGLNAQGQWQQNPNPTPPSTPGGTANQAAVAAAGPAMQSPRPTESPMARYDLITGRRPQLPMAPPPPAPPVQDANSTLPPLDANTGMPQTLDLLPEAQPQLPNVMSAHQRPQWGNRSSRGGLSRRMPAGY